MEYLKGWSGKIPESSVPQRPVPKTTGIGENKLRELTQYDHCDFVLWVGNKRLIKRKKLEEYIDKAYSI